MNKFIGWTFDMLRVEKYVRWGNIRSMGCETVFVVLTVEWDSTQQRCGFYANRFIPIHAYHSQQAESNSIILIADESWIGM